MRACALRTDGSRCNMVLRHVPRSYGRNDRFDIIYLVLRCCVTRRRARNNAVNYGIWDVYGAARAVSPPLTIGSALKYPAAVYFRGIFSSRARARESARYKSLRGGVLLSIKFSRIDRGGLVLVLVRIALLFVDDPRGNHGWYLRRLSTALVYRLS